MNDHMKYTKQGGFTLVELVMVIILIGVLSYGASSLFFTREAYAPYIGKDQFISTALLAQQIAMGMSATTDPVSLEVGVSGDNWVFTLSKLDQPDRVITQEHSGAALVIDGSTIGDGGSRTFTWNSQASLVDGLNHEVRFVGETSYRACLSASGFPYERAGACP